MRICNENKIYMKYSLFWWLNFGTLKQFMMTMPFLTSIQLCLNSLSSDLHLPILLLFLGNQLKAETVRLAISPHPVQQSRIWLNCPAAEKNPGILRKRNVLVSVKTTDFEKTTIQAHSALSIILLLNYPPEHTCILCRQYWEMSKYNLQSNCNVQMLWCSSLPQLQYFRNTGSQLDGN